MVQGILILVFMIAIMAHMVTRKIPTVVALFILAIGICLIGGVPAIGKDADGNNIGFFNTVIVSGAVKLSANIMIAIFAGWLGSIMEVTNITGTMIKKGAELGGDKTIVVHLILFAIASFLFSVVVGLGGAIMIGTIVIPILIAVGVDKTTAAATLLFSYGVGNTFSLSTTNNYASITTAQFETVYSFSLLLAAIAAVAGVIFIIYSDRKNGKKFAFSAPVEVEKEEESAFQVKGFFGVLSMLSPIIPIILVAVFKVDTIPALMIAILWAILTTCLKAGWNKTTNMMVKTFYKGFSDTAPAACLMIAIGMLLNAVNTPAVSSALQPFMQVIVPTKTVAFILFFAVLAPLCLYRGPLNLWGMGAGLAALIVSLNLLPANAVMAGFVSVAVMQVICCPTNTHNVWASGFVGDDVTGITMKQLPFVWPAVAIMVVVGTVMYF